MENGEKMKKIKNIITTTAIAIGLALFSICSSLAGQWQLDDNGKKYIKDDGTYEASGWQKINEKFYYFDENGYVLKNTVTPDGYTVDERGICKTMKIEEGSQFYQPYCIFSGKIYETGHSIIYKKGDDFVSVSLDGSSQNVFYKSPSWDNVYIMGADNKIYGYSNQRKMMYRVDETGRVEDIYFMEKTGNITFKFADSMGVQIDEIAYDRDTQKSTHRLAYYDIASGQIIWDKVYPPKSFKDFESYRASDELRAAIPHHDYDIARVWDEAGDYVKVITVAHAQGRKCGEYIINTKDNTCVAYKTGENTKFEKLNVTALGLMAGCNERIENGTITTLVEEEVKDYLIKDTVIYYINSSGDLIMINNILPAPLPTLQVN